MSTTNNTTTYEFTFIAEVPNEFDNIMKGSFVVNQTGMTDSMALSFMEAFEGLSWPSGVVANATCIKHVDSDTVSQGDPSTGTFI